VDVDLGEAHERAQSLLDVLATERGWAVPVVNTLEFGSGGHAFLADVPRNDLDFAFRWLQQHPTGHGLRPLLIEECVAFESDYDDSQEGTSAEILAAAASLRSESVVAKFRGWGDDGIAALADHPYRHGPELLPDDPDFWKPAREEPGLLLGGDTCIGLFPVDQAHDVIAEIGWHAFNNITAPEHLTMLRYFEDTFGMELISISGDGYGLAMTEPLRDRATAVDLATVLLGYADSADPGGTRTELSELASYLLVGRYLRLWYD
jgi:hypothetical protein